MAVIRLLLLLAVSTATSAHADIVTGALSHPIDSSIAPVSVRVIFDYEITALGYRTIGEALVGMRMLRLKRPSADYRLSGMDVTSFDSRILVLIDGHRLNMPTGGDGVLGYSFPISIDDIDRIEIMEGPNSTIYGSDALVSVINIVTKKGAKIRPARLKLLWGDWKELTEGVAYGIVKADGTEEMVSAEGFKRKGRDIHFGEYGSFGDGVVADADRQRADRFLVSSVSNSYALTAGYFEGSARIPTAPFGSVFGANNAKRKDERQFFDIEFRADPGSGKSLSYRIGFDKIYYKRELPLGFDISNAIVNNPAGVVKTDLVTSYAEGKSMEFGIKYSEKWLDSHLLSLGYDYLKFSDLDLKAYDGMGMIPTVVLASPYDLWSLYLMDEYYSGRLGLSFGIRYDKYDNLHKSKTGRFGLVYGITEATTLKTLYSEGYRMPTPWEKFFGDGVAVKGNPDLGPEKSESYELTLDHKVSQEIGGTVSVFRRDYSDLITLETDPSDGKYRYANSGLVRMEGVEAFADFKFTTLILRGGYSYAEAVDRKTHSRLPETALHTGFASLITSSTDGSTSGLDLRYTGRRIGFDGNMIEGRYILNYTIRFTPLQNMYVSVTVYNVFNRCSGLPASSMDSPVGEVEGAGRNYGVKVVYTF